MPKIKNLKSVKNTRNDADTDFTFKNQNFCIVKFDARTILNLDLDKETGTLNVRVTDTFTGKQLKGVANLTEVE